MEHCGTREPRHQERQMASFLEHILARAESFTTLKPTCVDPLGFHPRSWHLQPHTLFEVQYTLRNYGWASYMDYHMGRLLVYAA